jgi:hypothetical protein
MLRREDYVYVVDVTISADKVQIEEVRQGALMSEIFCRTGFKVVESVGIAMPRREIIIWNFQ